MSSIQRRISNLIHKYQKLTGSMLTIGTVESATGGAISDRLTNIPGSSHYYKGSIISYANAIKSRIVGVTEEIINLKGAVSYETGKEMASCGRKLLDVDICVADTGIAGPKGAMPGKPVGLFYIAMSCYDGTEICIKHQFKGNRTNNKKSAACTALEMIADYISGKILRLQQQDFNEKRVVTSFITHQGKVLVLRRSNQVGTYRGKWSGVSGYLEKKPRSHAYTEIEEETGLDKNRIRLLKQGVPFSIIDESLKIKWKIYPFAFETDFPKSISIDWENIEFRWVKPEEIDNLPTVPGLKKALDSVFNYS